jgi:hypothetical protein
MKRDYTKAVRGAVREAARPIWPFAVLHAICTGATPPEVIPETDIEEAVVVEDAAGLWTASVSAAGGFEG